MKIKVSKTVVQTTEQQLGTYEINQDNITQFCNIFGVSKSHMTKVLNGEIDRFSKAGNKFEILQDEDREESPQG